MKFKLGLAEPPEESGHTTIRVHGLASQFRVPPRTSALDASSCDQTQRNRCAYLPIESVTAEVAFTVPLMPSIDRR
jgi:hypothetical protein